jgi:hypothetical protein
MNRMCAISANRFCFVCGLVLFLKNKRIHTTHLRAAYMSNFRKQFSCHDNRLTKSHGNLKKIFFATFLPKFSTNSVFRFLIVEYMPDPIPKIVYNVIINYLFEKLCDVPKKNFIHRQAHRWHTTPKKRRPCYRGFSDKGITK